MIETLTTLLFAWVLLSIFWADAKRLLGIPNRRPSKRRRR